MAATPHRTVYMHFEILENIDNVNYKAQCKHCNAKISTCGKATSNLITHLKRKHHREYENTERPKVSEQTTIFNFVQDGKKYSAKHPRQTQITDKVLHFVAGTLQPLSVIESDDFQSLMSTVEPQYTLPSRKHLATVLIQEKCDWIHHNMCQILQQVPSVCVTVNLWSNRQMRSFFGMTGHFVWNWKLHSMMLSCKNFKGRHTADNIYSHYAETISIFGLNNKISNVISDNAANMTKAFSLPGYEHVDTDDLDESDIEDEGDSWDTDDHSDLFEFITEHNPCFAHTLQLVVKDGLKEAGTLRRVISKASTIVSHIRKSTHATELLECEKRVQAATPTHWNSEVKMLRSVLAIPAEKLDRLDTLKLTAHDRNLIVDLCDILTPFEEATYYVQRQNTVSSSYIIPCVLGLKAAATSMNSQFNCKMVTALKVSVDRRLSSFEKCEALVLATALDPRFKLQWCPTDNGILGQTRATLLAKAGAVTKPLPTKTAQGQSPPRKRSKLFSFMTPPARHSQTPSDMEKEIEKYISTDCMPEHCDPLQYWDMNIATLPTLAALAQRYLGIPASSAPVERLFSIGGKIFRSERSRLTNATFERLMCIKVNGQYA